jgi:hypothetical protein
MPVEDDKAKADREALDAKRQATKARLEALRAKQAERSQAQEDALDELEVQALELVEKYEGTLGPRGIAFALVATRFGNFIVKTPGDAVSYKVYDASKKEYEDLFKFVCPYVVEPKQDVARTLFAERAILLTRCGNAIAALLGNAEGETRGKS